MGSLNVRSNVHISMGRSSQTYIHIYIHTYIELSYTTPCFRHARVVSMRRLTCRRCAASSAAKGRHAVQARLHARSEDGGGGGEGWIVLLSGLGVGEVRAAEVTPWRGGWEDGKIDERMGGWMMEDGRGWRRG